MRPAALHTLAGAGLDHRDHQVLPGLDDGPLGLQDLRRSAFLDLVGAMALHLGLDLLQDHQGVGYLLAYPFSDVLFELGWIGSEDSVLVAPVLAAGALIAIPVWNRTPNQNGMT
jgi:hypothetical protein